MPKGLNKIKEIPFSTPEIVEAIKELAKAKKD